MKTTNEKIRIKSSVYPENWNPNTGFNEWGEYIHNEIRKANGVSKGVRRGINIQYSRNEKT